MTIEERPSVARRLGRRLQLDVIGAWHLVGVVPPFAWVCIIVAVSTVVYASHGATVAAPAVFADELIHARLALAIANGDLTPLHEALGGYGVVAALVGALPLRLGGDMERGYVFLKAFDSFVMSLAAVPAYFIGRRMLRPPGAVVVAGLTVAVPSMVFTALVMRESVFYPLLLCVVVVILRALERPSSGRQICAILAVAAAYVTRPQAIVVLPAYLAAIVLNAWLDSRAKPLATPMASTLRRYGPTAGMFALLTLAVAVSTVAGDASPTELLGRYSALAASYSPVEIAHWTLVSLADLDLYVGIVGLAGFVLGCARGFDRLNGRPGERAFVAAALPLVLLVLVEVGTFSTSPLGQLRIHDRNLFPLVPLLLVGAVAWIEQGLPRPRRLTFAVVVVLALLPALIPFESSLDEAWVDQVGILVWISTGVSSGAAMASMVGIGVAGAALIVFLPCGSRWLLVGVIGLTFVVTGAAARWQGQQTGRWAERHPTWVEEAAGGSAPVTVLFVDSSRCSTPEATKERWIAFWRAAFFNPSLAEPVSIGTPLPESTGPSARVLERGRVVTDDGRPLSVAYILVDERLPLRRGVRVAQSRAEHLALWRVDGDVRLVAPSERRARQLVCGTQVD